MKKKTRDHLLQVALALFLEKSFKEVTLRDLVARSGLSKGAFYHYFESKEAIFVAAIEEAFNGMSPDYERLDQQSLVGFYQGYLQQMQQLLSSDSSSPEASNPNFYSLIFDALKHFADFREQIMAFENQELQTWMAVIANARQQGEIASAMSDDAIARVFIYTADGIGLRAVYQAGTAEMAPKIQVLWDSIYAGLKSPERS